MKKIGELATEGGGGTIYQEGSEFIFRFKFREIDKKTKKGKVGEASERFPSLEALRQRYSGFYFKPDGSDSFIIPSDPEKSETMAKMADELEALYEERDAEGLNRFQ